MKTIFILVLSFYSQIILAQVDGKFVEMKGLEDSAHNTHLFYRYSYHEDLGNFSYRFHNDIHHLNLNNNSVVLFLLDYRGPYNNSYGIEVFDFEFWNNDPTKYIYCGTEGMILIGGQGYIRKSTGICQTPSSLSIYRIVISDSDPDLVFCEHIPSYITYKSTDAGVTWDALDYEFGNVIWINNFNNEVYSSSNQKLMKSNDSGNSFYISDSSDQSTVCLWNDKDSSYIYRLDYTFNSQFFVSDSNGLFGSWKLRYTSPNNLFISIDTSISGSIYLAENKNIYHSSDFGGNFTLIKTMDNYILGIYKKPSSDKLYVMDEQYIYQITDTSTEIIKSATISDIEYDEPIVQEFHLSQNYPNPFNPSTRIKYQVSSISHVTLKVYDVLGNEIATLVDEEKSPGTYEVTFNPESSIRYTASGVYFFKLISDKYKATRKMLYLK
jgi:hypothetical protein